MNIKVLSVILLVFWSLTPALAEEKAKPGQAGPEKAPPEKVYHILPGSGEMVGAFAERVDPVRISSLIADPGPTAYAFSAGVSKERGSVMLGVLLTDLEIYVRARDREKVLAAVTALIEGLVELGADQALFRAAMNLRVAVHNNIPLEAVNKATLPVLRPFIEAFAAREGFLLYMRLGEWIESMYLVASLGDSTLNLMRMGVLADYFAKELSDKEVPGGIREKLSVLSDLAKKESLSVRDYRIAREAARSIKTLMM